MEPLPTPRRPSDPSPDLPASDAAWAGLVTTLGALPDVFRSGERAVTDPQSALEGFGWMLSLLHVGVLSLVWADPQRPAFVDIVGPQLKWGGDNADAFYCHAAVDPERTYRVVGNRGDAVYFSLTVYGGPRDGGYSERIVGSVNDEDLEFGDDGSFELVLGPPGGPHDLAHLPRITLDTDAVCAITRDYQAVPGAGRRVEWRIECLDPAPLAPLTDSEVASRLRAVTNWLDGQSAFQPLSGGAPNVVDPPYPVPTTTFGWAAGDAAYAMGRFALRPDQALVVRGRSPECRFWNLCLWNPFLHTFDYRAGRVTINGFELTHEPDGSWVIVVSERDPGHPNWVATQSHGEGLLWFRWFLPADTPEQPTTEVVAVDGVVP